MGLEEAVLLSVNALALGCFIGMNIRQYNDTLRVLMENPFRSGEYETQLKNNCKKSLRNFVYYYAGYIGRQLAYDFFDDPNNWNHR